MLKRLVPLVFSLTITSAVLFSSAGTFAWPNAWAILALHFAASVTGMIILWRNPELQEERRNVKRGKGWDKIIVPFVVLIGPVATWATAGLDYRFHWSESMPPWTFSLALVIAALAAALVAWAMHANRFFSAVVRIQKDRGHVVISSGPYRFVRHPGYSGIAAFTLVTPLILNSRRAFIPAFLTAAFTVLRTALEDRTLHQELDGYPGYARKVPYRLIPPLW